MGLPLGLFWTAVLGNHLGTHVSALFWSIFGILVGSFWKILERFLGSCWDWGLCLDISLSTVLDAGCPQGSATVEGQLRSLNAAHAHNVQAFALSRFLYETQLFCWLSTATSQAFARQSRAEPFPRTRRDSSLAPQAQGAKNFS